MPIYANSKLSINISNTLFKNLSTLQSLILVDNFNVNYFVIRGFFRHLEYVYRL
jgi:hypothetical protein